LPFWESPLIPALRWASYYAAALILLAPAFFLPPAAYLFFRASAIAAFYCSGVSSSTFASSLGASL